MSKGRRSVIRRHLGRSLGAIDRYLHHLKACSEIIAEDSLELDKSIEALAAFGLLLQIKTRAFHDRI